MNKCRPQVIGVYPAAICAMTARISRVPEKHSRKVGASASKRPIQPDGNFYAPMVKQDIAQVYET